MNNKNTQQNSDGLGHVFNELAERPEKAEIEKSFNACMEVVTKTADARIPIPTPYESSFISPFFMQFTTKTLSLGTVAIALILAVGYMTFPNGGSEYEDIMGAAVGDESSYEVAYNDDDALSDIAEEDISADLDTTAATQNSTTGAEGSQSIEGTLALLDTIYQDEDINDTTLEAWFSDTSDSDILTQTYDI